MIRNLRTSASLSSAIALGGLCLIVACVSLGRDASAQSPERPRPTGDTFEFVIPYDDSSKGTATDVSFLNVVPAGKNGRIVARDGHFVESKTNKRVRFLGTNLGGRAAFPATHLEADLLAAHLAKLGVNLVRLHHLNNGWALDGGTVWKANRVFVEMDPAQLDKLDYLIYALASKGIYVNVNLQTAREYVPELGFPESVRELKNFAKKVDKFDERMIQLQQDYARDLLDRTNPYTKTKYSQEPALAFIEINNENSLVGWPGESAGAGLTALPEYFRGELVELWNKWLGNKYKTREALLKAWQGEDSLHGPSLIQGDKAWSTENAANLPVEYTETPATKPDASRGLKVVKEVVSGPDWHVQAHQTGLNLEDGKVYTLVFRAKSDRPNHISAQSRLDQPDWRFLGLDASFEVGTDWRQYTASFRASATEPNHARIGFVLGPLKGTLWLEDVQLFEGFRSEGLGPDEQFGKIDLPAPSMGPRFQDYTQFLAETERSYSNRMRNYLRKGLGFTATNIADTQISYGGLTGLSRERDMDWADNHAYWNHPTFLGQDWDPVAWRVDRTSMSDHMDRGAILMDLARNRVAGKPYSVSEYNHPAPSDFQSEMMPLYSAVGAVQDWDAIYTFAWDENVPGQSNDRIRNWFDISTNPAKSAFLPSAALIFRESLLEAPKATGYLQVGPNEWKNGLPVNALWDSVATKQKKTYSLYDRRLGVFEGPQTTLELQGTSPARLQFLAQEGGGTFVADAPRAKVASGRTRDLSLEGLKMHFRQGGPDFAAMTLVPLDAAPLAKSRRMLLTLVGRVENKRMGWNEARDSVGDQWGEGPTIAELVPCDFRLQVTGSPKVFALDGRGARVGEIPTRKEGDWLLFSTDRDTRSLWLEIASE